MVDASQEVLLRRGRAGRGGREIEITVHRIGERLVVEKLERLFAPDESSVTLQLLEKAALALGRKLKIELA